MFEQQGTEYVRYVHHTIDVIHRFNDDDDDVNKITVLSVRYFVLMAHWSSHIMMKCSKSSLFFARLFLC